MEAISCGASQSSSSSPSDSAPSPSTSISSIAIIAVVAIAGAARLLLLLVVVVIGGVGCRVILQAGLTRVEYIRRDVLGGLPSRRVGREVCVDHFVQHSAAVTGSHRHRAD